METKSLYTILGVRPDASSSQIETAYAELLHLLQDGAIDGDSRVRLVAVKEAYTVLSDPIARQHYNQKLFAPKSLDLAPEIVVEPPSFWSTPKLLIVGAIVIAAVWVYNRNAIEKEKLLIEHEKQLISTQIELEQKQREEQRALQEAAMQRQQAFQKEAQERAQREQMLRESRELSYRLQREQDSQQQREAREKQQAQREEQYQRQQEEARQRQLKYEAERQLDREKQALRNLQNENRSNNGRYY